MLTTILIVSVVIITIVLILSVVTTSKAYQFKHTIDPSPLEKDTNIEQEESK
ncbi:YtzI protein [Niallia sp. Krafla_26]|uniref:YtzI protein n=1 Tax=Niallia sp. Krafla_26 TaxID=3064703 RepID=UPI003D174874